MTHGISRMPEYASNVCFKRPSPVAWRVKEWSLTSSTSRLDYPGTVNSDAQPCGAKGSGRRMARPLRHMGGEQERAVDPSVEGSAARFVLLLRPQRPAASLTGVAVDAVSCAWR